MFRGLQHAPTDHHGGAPALSWHQERGRSVRPCVHAERALAHLDNYISVCISPGPRQEGSTRDLEGETGLANTRCSIFGSAWEALPPVRKLTGPLAEEGAWIGWVWVLGVGCWVSGVRC